MHKTATVNLINRQTKARERMDKINAVIDCLMENARMSLSEISRRTGIPVTTMYDMWPEIMQHVKIVVKKK